MSSGTPKYPDAFRVGVQQANKAIERIMRQGLSPRQQDLNRLWAYYCAEQYDACKIGWNGKEIQDDLQHDTISRTGVLPPGFYNAAAFDEMPLEYRRARAPYHLVRVVVNRFTSLLFSARRRPKIKVAGSPDGSPDAQTFIENLIKVSRFWARWSQARAFGGGCGSVGLTYRFANGTPIIEVHDSRWCTPTFKDRATGELSALEIRFMYPEEVRNGETGVLEEVWFWYRRTIDENEDVTYLPAPVGEGDEPIWMVDTAVEHLLEEFPGVWVRNTETDAVDGEPDCHGVFDTSDEIDMLISQASQGALENCLGVETTFITKLGVRSFADYSSGDEIEVLTHTGAWKRAVVRSFGEQKLHRFTFGRGRNTQTIRATKDHGWLLDDGSTSRALVVGDKIAKPPHLIRDWSYEESPGSQQRFWARGFAFGDGAVSRCPKGKAYGSRIRLCGSKARFLERFDRLGYACTFPKSSNGEPTVWMRDYEKTLPDLGIDGIDNVMAFVRGYLDADGSRNLRHPGASDISQFQGIQATGADAIAFIRNVFPVVGAYIVNEDVRTDQATSFGERSDVTIYFSLVLGFSSSAVAPYNVREIVEDVSETVWCLTVDDNHSFVMPNGIVTRNCDPTLHIADDSEANDGIKKGSRNAIKTSGNGKLAYVEMTGAGVETALKVAERLRRDALEVVQCILDNDQIAGPAMTATEIERRQETMFDRGDAFREQYGTTGVKPLLEKMVRAVVKLGSGIQVGGEIRRATFAVPGNLQAIANRDVATPLSIDLDWPPWVTRGPTDAQAAAGAATIAVAGGILPKQKALEYIATYFDIDDTAEAQAQLDAETQAASDAMTDQVINASRAPGAEVPPESENPAAASHPPPPAPPPTAHPPAPPHLPPVSGS